MVKAVEELFVGYYDSDENVKEYIEMAKGYDGHALVDVLKKYLKSGSTVLELGMGPGKDLELLSEHYQVTGSDSSTVFLDRYRQETPDADLVQLDAVTMEIERQFAGIFSNKVLHHLSRPELKESLQRQACILNDPGILLHSFWYGRGEEEFSGLRFVYYTKDSLKEAIGDEYEIIEFERYTEIEANDSFYIVLRKSRKRP
jgi:trans-aconitate methyltransferase